MTCPQGSNLSRKEFQKLTHYKDLEIEVTKMWKLKTNIVAVVVGTLGMIEIGTEQHVNKIPGNINMAERQKITFMGTAHILQKTLSLQ